MYNRIVKSTLLIRWGGKKTIKVTICVSRPTLDALTTIQQAYGMTKSTMIRDMIHDLIDSEYEKAKLILETRSKKVNQQSQSNTANLTLPENIPSSQ